VTIRETIIGLVIGYLQADTPAAKRSPAAADPPAKPAGLTIYRERTRAIEEETLPAVFLYFEDKPGRLISANYNAPLVERELTISMEFRAAGAAGAIDPLYAWAMYQIFGNESFGGLVNSVEEGKTEWLSKEGDVPLAASTTQLSIKYRTSRIDPSSRT
jgi:hypothetical protein